MKKLAKILTVLISLLVFNTASTSAVGIVPTAEEYVTIIQALVAGQPLDASKLPKEAVIKKKDSETIQGQYKGVHFENSCLAPGQDQQFSSIKLAPDDVDTDTAPYAKEILKALTELYGPPYTDYNDDNTIVYVWEPSHSKGFGGSYHVKGGKIQIAFIPAEIAKKFGQSLVP